MPQTDAVAQRRPADFKNPQPERGPNGAILPGRFTLTICAGSFYDMTPKKGPKSQQDLYQTPVSVKVKNTVGTAASGREQGTNGTIRISSGAPGVPAGTGTATISYDIVDGDKVLQSITVTVTVINCTPPPAKKSTPKHSSKESRREKAPPATATPPEDRFSKGH
jgi:hypothetical protein